MMSIPRVIAVGYDGSRCAQTALRWSAILAAQIGAEVRLVHAVGILEHAGLTSVGSVEVSARQVATEAGLLPEQIRWKPAEGNPVDVLCREAADGADILVVGTRGCNSHPGALLGSTSRNLVGRASVPVVVVPPSAPVVEGS